MLELIALSGIAGGIALFAQYLRGEYPFRRIGENVYQPTRWFLGTQGPVQGQGTVWDLSPLYDPIIRDGKIAEVSKEPRDVDFNFKFAAKPAFEGKFNKCQYTYQIETKKGAKKFFWEARNNINKVTEMVIGGLTEELGRRQGENVGEQLANISITTLDNLKDSERKEKNPYEMYGVSITRISLGGLEWGHSSGKILLREIEAEKEAKARIIRATSQAEEADIQSKATLTITPRYIEAGKMYKAAGSIYGAGDIANEIRGDDNLESIAGRDNVHTIVKTTTLGGAYPLPLTQKSESSSAQQTNQETPSENLEDKLDKDNLRKELNGSLEGN